MLIRVAGGAVAAAGGPVTGPPMEAEAGLQAAGPEGTGGATFVAEEPGPARVADALPKQWVAALAVLGVAEAAALAVEAIEAR